VLISHAEAGEGVRVTPCSDVYGNGVVGFVSPVSKRGQVRSRCRGGVPGIQRRSREGEEWSTATSTSVIDLPEALRAPAVVLRRLRGGEAR
jgi:hypothetical protein